jgi:hypothetical protein
MNALRLRRLGWKLLGGNGCAIELEESSNEYVALVIDDPARLGRWFQKDVVEPKSKTNVLFMIQIAGDDETQALVMADDFAKGSRFLYNGNDYVVERLMPTRIQDLTIFMFLIADPL